MNPATVFLWLLRASWQAAVLVVIVVLAQWLFKKFLSARWRYALWLLVIARLLLPVSPHSAVSLFNFAKFDPNLIPAAALPVVAGTSATPEIHAQSLAVESATPPSDLEVHAAPAPLNPQPVHHRKSRFSSFTWQTILSVGVIIWAIGVALLVMRVTFQTMLFVRGLRGAKPVIDPATLELFTQCQSLIGVRGSIGLVETDQVKSPVLHGLFRPCLLLPARMIGSFSPQELHYIFLHELAHVKRRDMAVHWTVTLLRILHWFNPVLWLGFRRLTADRELACDELALSRAGERASQSYGEAIIKVLEVCARPSVLPGVMGILESRDQMTRRIAMILTFKQPSRWPLLALGVFLAVGVVTLTDARNNSSTPDSSAKNDGRPVSDASETQLYGTTPNPFPVTSFGKLADGSHLSRPAVKGGDDRYTISLDGSGPKIVYNSNYPLKHSHITLGQQTLADSFSWTLSGRVIDSETHQPIDHFQVICGYSEEYGNRPNFLPRPPVEGRDGRYSISLDKHWSEPIVKISADGYVPQQLTVLPLEQTLADVLLAKGAGPAGVVLLPDGQPAAGISVFLICAGDQHVSFGRGGRLWTLDDGNVTQTDAAGHFSFAPQVGMQSIAAANKDAFKQIEVDALKTNQYIKLETLGQITGTLTRAGQPGTNETLDISFVGDVAGSHRSRIHLEKRATTDEHGHFEFDLVPPGRLQINYLESQPQRHYESESWQDHPLRQVNLDPAQSLKITIAAPARPPVETNLWQQPDGYQPRDNQIGLLTGRVLLPNGDPAVGAEVGVEVGGRWLLLGKAHLSPATGEFMDIARADGTFRLPDFTNADGVVAVSPGGFAKVSVAHLKVSSNVNLRAWGTIEGTLNIGRRPGSNEVVVVAMPRTGIGPLFYNNRAFQAKTDAAGHFVMTFMPPGLIALARKIPLSDSSWTQQGIGSVDVKAGGITKVSLGGNGVTVRGKVTLGDPAIPVDWAQVRGLIQTPRSDWLAKVNGSKTPAQMAVYEQTEEFEARKKAAWKDAWSYWVKFAADGSFEVEDVVPGKYELDISQYDSNAPIHTTSQTVLGHREIVIPTFGKSDQDAIDLGTLVITPPRLRTQTDSVEQPKHASQ